MSNWLPWMPMPRAWIKAILLILLIAGLTALLNPLIVRVIMPILHRSPRVGYLLYVLVIFSPIALIAILHHWLHHVLDQFFPESRLPETTAQGAFPSLVSWWEGLYGWLTGYLSTWLASALWFIIAPHSIDTVSALAPAFLQVQLSLNLVTVLQVFVAAFLYQFEYHVEQHLIAIGAGRE